MTLCPISSKANPSGTRISLVVEKLKEMGTLFHAQEFEHEYPHCWRCKKPVIFRATEQWFVKRERGRER